MLPATIMGSSNDAPTAATLAPPLTDPYSWFDYYDRDASNTLDQEEVISGLYKTIQVAQKNSSSASADADGGSCTSTATVGAIRESIQAIWPAFDIDGNGQVSGDALFVSFVGQYVSSFTFVGRTTDRKQRTTYTYLFCRLVRACINLTVA
jgi:hypothetical protein